MGIPQLNYHSWGCFVCCQIKDLKPNTCSTSQVMMSSTCDLLQTCANCINLQWADNNKAFLENQLPFYHDTCTWQHLNKSNVYSLSCDQITDMHMRLSVCISFYAHSSTANFLFPTDTHKTWAMFKIEY